MSILFIGLGSIGQRHLRNLLKIDQNAKIIAYRKRFNPLPKDLEENVKTYTEIDDALNNDIKFAIVSLPPIFHTEIIKKLVEKRINFLVEKPISNSLIGLENLLTKIEKKGLITMTAFNMRYHPCYLELKKVLDQKIIGNVVYFYSQVGQYLPDWHPCEDYRYSYSAKSELGGGVSLDLIHEIDIVTSLFGNPALNYNIKSKLSNLEINTEDTSTYLFKIVNGIQGVVHMDYVQRKSTRTIVVVGDKATITVDFLKCILCVESETGILFENKFPEFDRNDMYLNLLRDFVDAISKNYKLECDFKRGYDVLKWTLQSNI